MQKKWTFGLNGQKPFVEGSFVQSTFQSTFSPLFESGLMKVDL